MTIQFASDLIFNIDNFNEFLIARIFLLILIAIIVYLVLQKNEILSKRAGINKLIAVLIAILAIRFLPDNEFINGILLPYGVLGAALTTMLPFAIYFLFVFQSLSGSLLRRSAWILYLAFFLGLWWMRYDEISEIITYIYGLTFLLILISIVFDKQIRKIWGMKEINRFLTGANERTINSLQARYLNILNVNTTTAQNERDRIEQRLKDLGAGIP